MPRPLGAIAALTAILCAASCQGGAPATTPPAARAPLFGANFDGSAGPFDVYDYGTISAGARDGALHLTFSEAGDISTEQAFQQFGDVVVEVDATDVGPSPSGRFGVFCRLPEEGTYYQFFIASSGGAGTRVSGWLTSGSQAPVETQASAVHTGLGVANHVRADCVGPTFSLWVNGQLVSSFSDTSTAQGDVGFFATSAESGAAEVAFDNFAVYEP